MIVAPIIYGLSNRLKLIPELSIATISVRAARREVKNITAMNVNK